MKKHLFFLACISLSFLAIQSHILAKNEPAAPAKNQISVERIYSPEDSYEWQKLPQEVTAFAVQIPENAKIYTQKRGDLWERMYGEEDAEREESVLTVDQERSLRLIPETPDFDPNGREWSLLHFSKEPFEEFRFRVEMPQDMKAPERILFAFYDTRVSVPYTTAAAGSVLAEQGPKIISRAEWGADESLRYAREEQGAPSISGEETSVGSERVQACNKLQNTYPDEFETTKVIHQQNGKNLIWPVQYSPKIEKVVIHHTASAYDTSRDPKEVMRATYAFHARSRGWGDIGYNYLIDPYGNIYEGRAGGDYVVAGHVYCSNIQTIGVALMGNFQDTDPTAEQISALKSLLPTLAGKYSLDLTASSVFHGKELPNLLGHRDLGPTACPGEKMYTLLGSIREAIKNSELIRQVQKINRSAKFAGKMSVLQMKPNQTHTITYQFTNTGNVTWNKQNSWLYVVQPPEGISVRSNHETKRYVAGLLKETEVKPGGTATFQVEVQSKMSPGIKSLEFTPVVLERKVSGATVVQPVEVVKPDWDAKLQAFATNPSIPLIGEKIDLTVSVKNTGNLPWEKGKVSLSLKVNNKMLSAPLRENTRNSIGKFDFKLDPFAVANTYLLSAELLLDGKKMVGVKPFFIPLKIQKPEYKAKVLGPRIVKASSGANGLITSEVKLLNMGNIPWEKADMKLIVKSSTEQFEFPMSENLVESRETAHFPVFFIPKNKSARLYNFSLQAGTTTIAGINGRFLIRRSPVVPKPTTPAPTTSSQNLRVRLGYPNTTEAEILPSVGADVYIDGIKKGELTKDASKKFVKSDENVTFNGTSGKVIRIIPKTSENVTAITSWSRKYTWDSSGKINDNKFRGVLELRVYNGELVVINELPLEEYLQGLAETSNDTHHEKQKVMAIIARTYAAFYMKPENIKFPGAPYDGDDSPDRFQKYLGYGYELRSQNFVNAVKSTKGKVVTYNGKLVKTPYFSQSDGRTLSAQEVWGWTDTPYLQSVPDPFSQGLERKGHGVGLSGKGAEGAAQAGKSYEEIIKYYYQGVEIGGL